MGAVRPLLGGATAAGVLAGLLVIPQAGLMAWILDRAIAGQHPPAALLTPFLLLAGVMCLRVLLGWARETAGLAAALRIQGHLRDHLFTHLARLGPVRLADRHSGALSAALVEQVEALTGYYARYLPQQAVALAVPAAILIAAFTQDWVAALILLFTAPLIPLFMALLGMGAEQVSREQQEQVARLGGHFLDRLQGLTTLRLLNAQDRAAEEVARASEGYRASTMKVLRVAFLSSAVLEFFSAVAIALVAMYVGFGLIGYLDWGPAEELTLFSGVFVLLMAPDFFQPLRQLAQHYHDRASALGAAQTLMPLLERRAPDLPASGRGAHQGQGAAIHLQDVHLRFDGDRRALEGVDLSIAPGERVALVGPSGAGKSSLLHLLAGFIEPDRGQVRVNGEAPDPVAQAAWVGQRPHVFAGTLADNIRLGDPGASETAVEAAARDAGVLEFAAGLPQGLDTPLGERGHGLSGGQGQRVALARAALKRAPLWLLDEPTAGLDPDTEARVLAALERSATAGATVLIASHHPRVMAWADRVVTLQDGRVVRDTKPLGRDR
ncbi:ATP-binding cassette, subfamily C, CydD [Ectothiorhodospira mobilis]|uniref:ATP-binding cassette, subfamily C, CydD n=1 Tax=Ectothiorhodospira mobilis TaxID=195064 RepID=A0A1I4PTK9_ECTMO|nr:ATP-binding cassette, subfamily C, CydD [Ectothiorhodospira mobilis]